MSVGKPIPLEGSAIVDLPVIGFEDHFDVEDLDEGDLESVKSRLRDGEIDLVVSRNREILEVCVEETITYFSTIESAEAALEAIESADQPLNVQDVATRPKDRRNWGQ
jgi:carbamoyl-phosphate synthase large subunit